MNKPRRGFRHWLGDRELPRQLEDAKLLRYYTLLRHGKNPGVRRDAAQVIVMAHVRLGMATVARWAVTYPTRTDEMVSEMLDALVDGVKMISEGALDNHEGQPNIVAYLVRTMYGRINKLLSRDKYAHAIYLGGKHIRGRGKASNGKDEDHVRTKGRKESKLEKALSTKGDQPRQELMEIITRSIQTEQERTVIDLRVEGFDDTQIGQMMKPPLTKGRVHQIRTAVKRRIEKELA